MSKLRVFSYKSIDNISKAYLDYLLIDSLPRRFLEGLLKGNNELTKRVGLTGFRLSNVEDYKLKIALVKYLPKDMNLYSRIYRAWSTMWEDELEDFIELEDEEFIKKVPSAITSVNVPNIVNFIRENKEELYPIAAPLLKEWQAINIKEKEIAGKLEFNYDGDIFSKIYGFDPFIDLEVDPLEELELDDIEDEESIEEEEEKSIEKVLAKQIMDMPMDKSLSAILISLGAFKNKLSRATDFENLYKSSADEVKKLREELENFKKENSELKAKLKEKEAAFDSLQKKMNSNEKKIEGLNQKIVIANTESGRLGSEVESLRKELTVSKDKLYKAEKQAEEYKLLIDKKTKDTEKAAEFKYKKELNKLREGYETKLKEKASEIEKLRIIAGSNESKVTLGELIPNLKDLFGHEEEESINIGSVSLVEDNSAADSEESDKELDWFEDISEFMPN